MVLKTNSHLCFLGYNFLSVFLQYNFILLNTNSHLYFEYIATSVFHANITTHLYFMWMFAIVFSVSKTWIILFFKHLVYSEGFITEDRPEESRVLRSSMAYPVTEPGRLGLDEVG